MTEIAEILKLLRNLVAAANTKEITYDTAELQAYKAYVGQPTNDPLAPNYKRQTLAKTLLTALNAEAEKRSRRTGEPRTHQQTLAIIDEALEVLK